MGFLILARGVITSKFVIYEQLFNPILSDSFGFTVKQTSYFFLLLLPTNFVAAFSMRVGTFVWLKISVSINTIYLSDNWFCSLPFFLCVFYSTLQTTAAETQTKQPYHYHLGYFLHGGWNGTDG